MLKNRGHLYLRILLVLIFLFDNKLITVVIVYVKNSFMSTVLCQQLVNYTVTWIQRQKDALKT